MLGFGRGRGPLYRDLEQVASFVNGLPKFIRLAGLKRHRFVAKVTDWVGHTGLQASLQIIRLHKEPTPRTGTAEGCVKDF